MRFALVLSVALFSGCTIAPSYVKADRATYNAIAPEYRAYVDADPKLDQSEKTRRRGTLQSWDARLSEEEGK